MTLHAPAANCLILVSERLVDRDREHQETMREREKIKTELEEKVKLEADENTKLAREYRSVFTNHIIILSSVTSNVTT